ncbi:putative membrane protein [Rhodopseudomonas thermotolerans]|jgi:putative membrane protein|uniref:Membrane protein n=2 Tax=Rhodopseudomonas TaxID=1073 RepID=A0A336JTY9_9BRAD|nr:MULTISPECIES: TIGR01620 family protein [Rhodopseudomonas]RED24237.1 putative membrane protein [Rhodopseudomonas pentothenatexigens]REF90299.1 putative membrane protein [Rhodopseudomonas thermotolerans]SSW93247.1 putative membrane protein [Rhodopseudomonas pentothenatexigens]
MTERVPPRRPATFKLTDPSVVLIDSDDGGHAAKSAAKAEPKPSVAAAAAPPPPPPPRARIELAREAEPPIAAPKAPKSIIDPKKGFRWGTLFWSAATGLATLAFWLWISKLVEDLFAQSQTLGTIGMVLALLAGGSLAIIIGREAFGLIRLARIEQLHARAARVLQTDNSAEARAIVRELLKFEHPNPQLARGRSTLQKHVDDIIDGADLIRLAERELMTPLDLEARALISKAAQRVSLVTAISPKALIDVLFVAIAATRLIGQLARLYGGRPGAIGMMKLMRQTVSHLAVTGGIALSDSVMQSVLGHGLASRLSAKLGEGVVNGMLTARLGIAAIDLTRPLPFDALPRPQLGDLVKDLMKKREKEE